MSFVKRMVLAYSGGLDTSVAIHRLKAEGWDVIARLANVDGHRDHVPALGFQTMDRDRRVKPTRVGEHHPFHKAHSTAFPT